MPAVAPSWHAYICKQLDRLSVFLRSFIIDKFTEEHGRGPWP